MRYFFIVKSAPHTAGKDYIAHLNKALLSTDWIYFKMSKSLMKKTNLS